MGLFDFLIGLLLLPAAIADSVLQIPTNFPTYNTTINGHNFTLLTADNVERWQHGFKNRIVKDDEAMLFDFPKNGTKIFWMKGTKTPLDIVFLNAEYEVTKLVENAQPCRVLCKPYMGKAKYVLEFKAGVAKEVGITMGSVVKIKDINFKSE
ncbi:MAG: DUF192 domain-containing protein [Candidatus Altiarchaeota archaeon]|nr:DUF192 domain-containing protein [Candidatus Altiarchaeota archaeon]